MTSRIGWSVALLALLLCFLQSGSAQAVPVNPVLAQAAAQQGNWAIVIVGSDPLKIGRLKKLVEASLGAGLPVLGLAYDPKSTPELWRQYPVKLEQLPLLALAKVDSTGNIFQLVGYPELAELAPSLKSEAAVRAASSRMGRRYQELLAGEQPQNGPQSSVLEIRGCSLQASRPEPHLCGTQLAVSLQASPQATVDVYDQADPTKTVSLMETGPGLYEGAWTLRELQARTTTLVARVSRQGQSQQKVLGTYQTLGWIAPKILSVNPSGPDLYQVSGMAPPFSQVEVRCHVDMGRFLFVGYPDYDNNWTVQADKDGQFGFVMDLSLGGTRRDDIVLTAQFAATTCDIHSGRRSETSEFSANVRMYSYPYCSGGCHPRCGYCSRYR